MSRETGKMIATRRQLMTSIASAGALAGLGGAMGQTTAEAQPTAAESLPISAAPEDLFAMARLRNYKNRRSSSWDRSGGNADWVRLEPGQTAILLDEKGAQLA